MVDLKDFYGSRSNFWQVQVQVSHTKITKRPYLAKNTPPPSQNTTVVDYRPTPATGPLHQIT